jgi:hypothetical protein
MVRGRISKLTGVEMKVGSYPSCPTSDDFNIYMQVMVE